MGLWYFWVALALFFSAYATAPNEYNSPYCGPDGGSPAWACGAWPTTTPPRLGPAGTITKDPDTGNRVLRATEAGSFGEAPGTAFKVLDGGWSNAWNADSSRFLVIPWNRGSVRHLAYWMGFDRIEMQLSGAKGDVPSELINVQWDPNDPDLIVGLVDHVAASYNVRTRKLATIFDPNKTNWKAVGWTTTWGGSRVCISEGPQDSGYRIACFDRDKSTTQVIDLRAQTINGKPFPVTHRGREVRLPDHVGIHAMTLGLDGVSLAIDTHGNAPCTVASLPDYASTALFVDLDDGTANEWNIGCGGTHWAYGYNGVMMQSATPKWTPRGNDGPCNSDSRGIARRTTNADVDSSFTVTAPCRFFDPATWDTNIHLSWTNNRNNAYANRYPVLLAAISGRRSQFLANEIAAMETAAPPYRGRLWRFAQTWNDAEREQCAFLDYSSPSISPDGHWALYPSNWRGQTGSGGVCARGTRTDVFIFELR